MERIRRGTTSSAGASDGTTLIDSSIGGSDNDYNGRYWLYIRDGNNIEHWCRVVDYATSTGTFTLENQGFPNQVASGTTYELWKSPEAVCVVTTASQTAPRSTARVGDGDDRWNGYYLIAISGSCRGEPPRLISDFTSSTGEFTCESFVASPSIGDVFLIGRFIEITEVQDGLEHGYNPRPGKRLDFMEGDGFLGVRSGTFGFTTDIRPTGSLASSGNAPGRSQLADLFVACGLEEVEDEAVVAQSGSTTSSINIATGTWERLTIGNLITWKGNSRRITSLTDGGGSDDVVGVSPPFPAAPAASDVLSPTRMYRKTRDGDTLGVTLEWEIDGIRHTMFGCKGNVTVQDGAAPLAAFAMSVHHWVRNQEAAPYDASGAYPTVAPVRSQDREIYFDGSGVNIGAFTATPGTVVSERQVQGSKGANGNCGFQLTDFEAGCTWDELSDSESENLTQEQRYLKRTGAVLLAIFGSHGSVFAVSLGKARAVANIKPKDSNGLVGMPTVWRAHDPGVTVDGAYAVSHIPDFAFHIS